MIYPYIHLVTRQHNTHWGSLCMWCQSNTGDIHVDSIGDFRDCIECNSMYVGYGRWWNSVPEPYRYEASMSSTVFIVIVYYSNSVKKTAYRSQSWKSKLGEHGDLKVGLTIKNGAAWKVHQDPDSQSNHVVALPTEFSSEFAFVYRGSNGCCLFLCLLTI